MRKQTTRTRKQSRFWSIFDRRAVCRSVYLINFRLDDLSVRITFTSTPTPHPPPHTHTHLPFLLPSSAPIIYLTYFFYPSEAGKQRNILHHFSVSMSRRHGFSLTILLLFTFSVACRMSCSVDVEV